MRTVPKRPSIQEIGLKVYLDKSQIDHNGLGYDQFVAFITAEEPRKMSKIAVAKAFHVQKATLYKWIRIYYKEQKHANKV